MIRGEIGNISIFRFYWFHTVWFYNPKVSFPRYKMDSGFFLDIVDNNRDGFSYEILPWANYSDISLRCNPVTLLFCVVRPRTITSSNIPTCLSSPDGLIFYNRHGVDYLGQRRVLTHRHHKIFQLSKILQLLMIISPHLPPCYSLITRQMYAALMTLSPWLITYLLVKTTITQVYLLF